MGEIAISPVNNVFKKYKEVIYVNPYLFVSSLDADASAFIAAATITDEGQKTAINNLVVGLKSNGLWSKMKAIYPIVGGTAFSHKWNLKDPRDLNSAFRLVYFTGTVVHNSNGLKGTNASIETNLNVFTHLQSASNHLSLYCTTSEAGQIVDMAAGSPSFALYQSFSGVFYSDNPSNAERIVVANSDPKGFYISTKTASNSQKGYKNGNVIVSNTTNVTTSLPNGTVWLLSNSSGSTYYSNRTYAFFTIGDGLNDLDSLNLYNAIQDFQTALGRQV